MLRWVDVSRYQVERSDPLDLAKAKTAGYQIVNVALTGGRGYVSGEWAQAYLDKAFELGMGRSTYHWLDGITSGAAQAKMQITRLRNLFGADLGGFAHCIDVEETGEHGITPPKWQHVYDYVHAMQDALGRHIVIYSGDWWWRPKEWPGATLTPYLMGMPNRGKLAAYPGDTASEWNAGWGGWQSFSIMQWGTAPLPGTGNCSLSVIRDPAVWPALTGGSKVATLIPSLVALRAEFNQLNPARDKASDGWIGDAAHQANPTSDHNPDLRGLVHAIDVDETGPWPDGLTMRRMVDHLIARQKSGADLRLKYVIYERQIASASAGWVWRSYSGANPHDKHAHFSGSYVAARENDTRPWGVLGLANEEDPDMTPAEMLALLKSEDGKAAIQDAVRRTNIAPTGANALSLGGAVYENAFRSSRLANEMVPKLLTEVSSLNAAIGRAQVAIIGALPPAPDGQPIVVDQAVLSDAIVSALRGIFAAPVPPMTAYDVDVLDDGGESQ